MINKQVIIKDLANELKCSTEISKDITTVFISIIANYLEQWEDINIPKIWRFSKVKRASKKWINPRTKETIQVPEYFTIRYRPAISIKKTINS